MGRAPQQRGFLSLPNIIKFQHSFLTTTSLKPEVNQGSESSSYEWPQQVGHPGGGPLSDGEMEAEGVHHISSRPLPPEPTVGSSLCATLPLCPPPVVAEFASGGGDVGSAAAMSDNIGPTSVERSRKGSWHT